MRAAYTLPRCCVGATHGWGGTRLQCGWLWGNASRSHARQASSVCDMPVVYHPSYSAPKLADGHRFPMQVFSTICQRLLQRGLISEQQLCMPSALPTEEELQLVHTEEYVNAFFTGTLGRERTRRIGFGDTTATPVLIERTRAEVAGTLLTAELALARGLAVNCAGGTHHAFPAHGSGYCILNDLAFTAQMLRRKGLCRRVCIVDLDVHQGDGTALMLQHTPEVFTFSMHCASNFPAVKQRSDLDIALPDGTGDAEYLRRLAAALPEVLAACAPDIVLYDAGVDVHAADALGRLALSSGGLRRRERLVLDTCLAGGIPVAGCVGGGYAANLADLADRHILLHEAALQTFREYRL